MNRPVYLLCLFIMMACPAMAQVPGNYPQPSRQDSIKGAITPERAWWNVLHYDLTVRPDYVNRTITGKNIIQYKVIQDLHTDLMQIDLQSPLAIDSVIQHHKRLSFRQDGNAWFIKIPQRKAGDRDSIVIYYSGRPKASVKPPWDGGVVWSSDSLGRPWMAVACQLAGASVWYPCKVHQSDEPDNGATITIVVPDTLVAVANGRLQQQLDNADGTATYKWAVVNPINNYGITFYIGKYRHVHDVYAGEKGRLDIDLWVMDYNRQRAGKYLLVELPEVIRSFEHWFGPYPFYEDGFKIVEAPYIGMEHQSAIAYGNGFKKGRLNAKRLHYWDQQTDRLLVHETAHEWFGNNITVKDPADRWVQEGFAALAEELFITSQYGPSAGNEFFVARSTGSIDNRQPLISRYNIFEDAGADMYMKGWALLHMVKAILRDDEKFREVLRGMNQAYYHRTVTSGEIEQFVSRASGADCASIFDQYLRTVQLPVLEYMLKDGIMQYRFTGCIPGFTMPVSIHLVKDSWIIPSTSWKEMRTGNTTVTDTLKVSPDFYLQVRKIEAVEQ